MVENAEEGEIPNLTDESYVNKPDSLRNICIQTACNNHFKALFYPKHVWSTTPVTLRKDIHLPAMLADDILHYLLKHTSLPIESILSAFSDSTKCSLNEFHLQNVDIGYHALLELSNKQKPQRIEIHQVNFLEITGHECLLLKFLNEKTRSFFIGPKVSTKAKVRFECLSRKKFPYLKSLKIIDNKLAWYLVIDPADPVALTTLELSCYMNPTQPTDVKREAASNKTFFNRISEDEHSPGSRVFPPFSRFDSSGDAPETSMLGDITLDDMQLIEKCDNFTEEDMLEDVSQECNSPLLPRYRLELMKSSLLSLTLYSNCLGPADFNTIFCLKQLRHLDIGVTQDSDDSIHATVTRPDLTVFQIMDALPNLDSLDVSSTEIGDRLYRDALSKPISGERFVETPVKRKLEFLGLLETEGCEVSNIHMLAHKVTGYASELQMMTGVEHYMNRPEMSATCYNHMYALNRNQPLSCPHKLLRLLLESMDLHPTNDRLLLTCTANFFFLTRRYCTTYSKQQKQSIILAIVKCLESNHLEHQVVRNSLLTLYHFDLPGDLVFSFLRITRVILKTFEQHQNNPDVNAIAVHMCNTLVVSLEHDMKKEVSKIDFVLTILNVIKQRLENEQCDEVMEVCWSTLWNVTDETPKNSSDFIALKGLDIMQKCFEVFPDDLELHKNIMGLVGNIAEVKELRSCLRKKERIDTFRLLMNRNNNIEVAYNSCGTLAHLMSDRGDDTWGLTEAEHDVISNEMYDVIEKWDINAARNINYRSFKPILQLLYSGVGESIHWACWALCNLSGFEDRYVVLMHKEDGRKYIEPLLSMEGLRKTTKELAKTLVDRLMAYASRIETSHD